MKDFLWVLTGDLSVLSDRILFDKCYRQISPARRKKIDRILSADEKRRSLGGVWLLLQVCKKCGLPFDEPIAKGENGKPFFENHPELQFSISHAGEVVVCAVSDLPVGCDVEKIGRGNEKIAGRFFTRTENDFLRKSHTPDAKSRNFCRIWTLKESFIKATGEGFARVPGSYSVITEDGNVGLCGCAEAGLFGFLECTSFDGYCSSVCRNGGIPADVKTEEIIFS